MAESNNLQEAVETQIMSQIWFQIETAATNAQCAKKLGFSTPKKEFFKLFAKFALAN